MHYFTLQEAIAALRPPEPAVETALAPPHRLEDEGGDNEVPFTFGQEHHNVGQEMGASASPHPEAVAGVAPSSHG